MTRSASASSAYDEDFFSWTQDQAAALRRAGAHGEIDIERLAEEIEDLGKRDLREVESFLELIIVHLMKIAGDPEAPSVPHWRSEVRAFSRSAAKAFSPGMRRLIDMPRLWEEALDSLAADRRDLGLAAPQARPCAFTLDDLLMERIDVDLALAKMSG